MTIYQYHHRTSPQSHNITVTSLTMSNIPAPHRLSNAQLQFYLTNISAAREVIELRIGNLECALQRLVFLLPLRF